MQNYSIKTLDSNCDDLDKYLDEELISYGVAEAGGHKPKYMCCYIKDDQHRFIGGIKGYVMLDLFYISQLFVDEKYRNIGLGKNLLSEIEVIAKKHACNTIRLDTLNKRSHSFYIKSGFKKTLEIKGYMKGFDLLFFHKDIN